MGVKSVYGTHCILAEIERKVNILRKRLERERDILKRITTTLAKS